MKSELWQLDDTLELPRLLRDLLYTNDLFSPRRAGDRHASLYQGPPAYLVWACPNRRSESAHRQLPGMVRDVIKIGAGVQLSEYAQIAATSRMFTG